MSKKCKVLNLPSDKTQYRPKILGSSLLSLDDIDNSPDQKTEMSGEEKGYRGLFSDDDDDEEEHFLTKESKLLKMPPTKKAPHSQNHDSDHKKEKFQNQKAYLELSLDDDDDAEHFLINNKPDFSASAPAEPPIIQGTVIYGDVPVMQDNLRDSEKLLEDQGVIIQGKAQLIQDDSGKIDRALAIAEDFVRRNNLISVGEVLWRYNGIFYYIFTESEAKRLIFQTYKKEISRASPVSTIRNVLELLKYCTDKVLGEFPVNPNIIVFENGTLEVTTGRFRKNSPNDLASSALGINYNPSRREMPYTKKFLETIADGDSDLYELMLQVIGYILSSDIRAKSFFYLEGVGNAGKSRFCDLVASFFPASGANKVARIALQDLGGKFALGNLVNAKLNISEDLPDSPLSPTTVSRIKMISDANRLEAEAKFVQAFSFKPQCKLLFASNHPLRLKESDAAFVNRVVYLPFLRAIPKHKQDPMILEKMKTELPALFNHAFQAYRRLVANGYVWAGSDKFIPEIEVVNSGISFGKERVLKDFVDTCCSLEKDATTPTIELQNAYQKFCDKYGYQPIMGDRFSRELAAVLPDSVSRVKIGNQKRGFKGIRLKTVSETNTFI